jgi:predicted AAA+ superfamily ATPase
VFAGFLLHHQFVVAADGQGVELELSEFLTYIDRNSREIPNYGERHRNGEAISSATAEATVDHVISRRMVKKQQMRWTPRGAHLLLQIRT